MDRVALWSGLGAPNLILCRELAKFVAKSLHFVSEVHSNMAGRERVSGNEIT